MENTPKENVPQPKEQKKKGSITGLLVGVIAFLILTLLAVLVFVFTDIGNTLYDKVRVEEGIETEEKSKAEKEVETDEVTLESEGWALYSIPEYGFSVEIPPTTEYIEDLEHYLRWEVSRSRLHKLREESLEEIHIDYYPSGLGPEARGCGQGCNGEIQIKVNYYDKETQYDLEGMKAKKRTQMDSWNETWEDSEGYEEETIEDYVQDPDPFGENVWCVNLPYIADDNFRECYFEKGEYLIEIVHTGRDFNDFGTDASSSGLYGILDSMKFE